MRSTCRRTSSANAVRPAFGVLAQKLLVGQLVHSWKSSRRSNRTGNMERGERASAQEPSERIPIGHSRSIRNLDGAGDDGLTPQISVMTRRRVKKNKLLMSGFANQRQRAAGKQSEQFLVRDYFDAGFVWRCSGDTHLLRARSRRLAGWLLRRLVQHDA